MHLEVYLDVLRYTVVGLVITSHLFSKTDTLAFLFIKRDSVSSYIFGVGEYPLHQRLYRAALPLCGICLSTDNNPPFRMKLDINCILVVEDETMETMRLRIILTICCTSASYSSFRRR